MASVVEETEIIGGTLTRAMKANNNVLESARLSVVQLHSNPLPLMPQNSSQLEDV